MCLPKQQMRCKHTARWSCQQCWSWFTARRFHQLHDGKSSDDLHHHGSACGPDHCVVKGSLLVLGPIGLRLLGYFRYLQVAMGSLRLMAEVFTIICWSALVVHLVETHEINVNHEAAPASEAILSLLGTLLFFLITFRSNQAYARWVEGRIYWGAIIKSTLQVSHTPFVAS
jgi:hypothetical protein